MQDAEPAVNEENERSASGNDDDTPGEQPADAVEQQAPARVEIPFGGGANENDVAAAAQETHLGAQVEAHASARCPVEAAAIARSIEVRFGFASASLHHAGWEELDRLATALKQCPQVRMVIEGHTDSDGDFYRNQSLSVRRALAVRQYLIDAGAGDGQLMVVGYGQERPLAPNDTGVNKSKNRRIEIVIE